jgi:hypothetical protein
MKVDFFIFTKYYSFIKSPYFYLSFMKLFFILSALLTPISMMSQELSYEFKKAGEIYFYGIEFSHARCFGDGFSDKKDFIERYMPDMNTYIWEERDRYNLTDLFNGKKILANFEEAIKNTYKINPETLVFYNATGYYHLNEDSIQNIVKQYKKIDGGGFGFVVIMEDLNKQEEYGSLWPTIFNMENGEVIYTKRYQDTPSGLGLKRYWLDPIRDAFLKFKKDINKLSK